MSKRASQGAFTSDRGAERAADERLRERGSVMRVRRYLVLLALVGFAGFAEAPSASAATASVTVHATINGRNVGSSSASHPVRLRPSVPALVQVRITNKSSSPVDIRRVELTGRVIGLSFFAFDTSVGLNVPAGTTDTLSYSLDLTGLRGQATGLMGGAVTVFDNHGHRVAREGMISDVRGSIVSVYGLFGFALLLLTVLAILDTAVAIARHGLPANRWRRGIRALTPGIGIGLVLVFTLSAADVAVPTGPRWLEAAVGFAVLFFVLGYLTPTPADARDDEVDDDLGDADSALTSAAPSPTADAEPPAYAAATPYADVALYPRPTYADALRYAAAASSHSEVPYPGWRSAASDEGAAVTAAPGTAAPATMPSAAGAVPPPPR